MFVITADQVGSRSSSDLVTATLERINDSARQLPIAAERTVGDELQLLLNNADDAFSVILDLTRDGNWSVGCGVGDVRTPLPSSIREATGTAFIAARAAIDRAKKSPTRFALETAATDGDGVTRAADAEALIDVVLALRSRRSAEGWQVHDLLESGLTGVEAAERLGITPQAVSDRARAADLRVETAARAPLRRMLANLANVGSATEGERAWN